MGHSQLTGDDAGTNTLRRELDDLQTDVVRQRPTVDEHTAELVDPALSWKVKIFRF